MAGRVKDTRLDSREARKKLPIRHQPYFRILSEGVHIGYRKRAGATTWVLRVYKNGAYAVSSIGSADDNIGADGKTYLSWWQAVDRARDLATGAPAKRQEARDIAGYTVAYACADYLAQAHVNGQKAISDSRNWINRYILPELGDVLLSELTARQITRWRNKLATTPPSLRTRKGEGQKFRVVDMSDPEIQRQRRASTNRIYTCLKAVCNLAFRQDRVSDDAAWRKVGSLPDADAARQNYATAAEVQRLINAAKPDFRPMIIAGFLTGARYSEICRLKVRDFDAVNGSHGNPQEQDQQGTSRHPDPRSG